MRHQGLNWNETLRKLYSSLELSPYLCTVEDNGASKSGFQRQEKESEDI
jgi:hypothetical protein